MRYVFALWYIQPNQPCCIHASLHGSRMRECAPYVVVLGEWQVCGSLGFGVIRSIIIGNCLLPHMAWQHCCLSCKTPLHCRLYEKFGMQWVMPPNFEYNSTHNVPLIEYCHPPTCSCWAWKYVKDLQGYHTNITLCRSYAYHKGGALIYLGFTPQSIVLRVFFKFWVIESHAGDKR